jgi:hypothetical protein
MQLVHGNRDRVDANGSGQTQPDKAMENKGDTMEKFLKYAGIIILFYLIAANGEPRVKATYSPVQDLGNGYYLSVRD